MVYVIRAFVSSKGLSATPDDLSKFPDYPKRPVDMPQEEFQKILKKYFEKKKKERQKERQREKKKDKMNESFEMDTDTFDTSISSKTPHWLEEIRKDYPDYPERTEGLEKFEYDEMVKQYFQQKGLKHSDDFTEEEKESIVEDCTVNLMGAQVVSQKHNTMTYVIKCIVQAAGKSITPDDLSKYPDYPKKSEEMSKEDYQIIVKKFWDAHRKKAQKGKEIEKRKLKKKVDRESRTLLVLETMIPEDLEGHHDFPGRLLFQPVFEKTVVITFGFTMPNFWRKTHKINNWHN